MEIQSIPNPDSPNNDAFEAIVELYYQTLGYITSSGKWFWVKDPQKKLRGYQDIDVLCINENEVLIVSVTSNLDDKLRFDRNGELRQDMLEKLVHYFERVELYLGQTKEYAWLVNSPTHAIKYILAYNGFHKRTLRQITEILKERGILTIASKEMFHHLNAYIEQPNLKIQDQMLRTIQLMNNNEKHNK